MCNGVIMGQMLNAGKVFDVMVSITTSPFRNLLVDHKTNKTLLMYACELGYLSIVNVLIKQKADLFTEDVEGKTALDYATLSGNVECAEMLKVVMLNIQTQ